MYEKAQGMIILDWAFQTLDIYKSSLYLEYILNGTIFWRTLWAPLLTLTIGMKNYLLKTEYALLEQSRFNAG